MSRPGEESSRKSSKTMAKELGIKELEMKERSSRSLLANVLDMDDDFRAYSQYSSNVTSNRYGNPVHGNSSSLPPFMPSQSCHQGGVTTDPSFSTVISGNLQSSTFGSQTGFTVDTENPVASYCPQVSRFSSVIFSFSTHLVTRIVSILVQYNLFRSILRSISTLVPQT